MRILNMALVSGLSLVSLTLLQGTASANCSPGHNPAFDDSNPHKDPTGDPNAWFGKMDHVVNVFGQGLNQVNNIFQGSSSVSGNTVNALQVLAGKTQTVFTGVNCFRPNDAGYKQQIKNFVHADLENALLQFKEAARQDALSSNDTQFFANVLSELFSLYQDVFECTDFGRFDHDPSDAPDPNADPQNPFG